MPKDMPKQQLLPKLRFPEFNNTPAWDKIHLGDEDASTFVKKRIPLENLTLKSYISTENLLPNYAGVKTASKLPPTGSFAKFKIGDILISNIRPYLKKVWLANKNGGASNDVLVIRAKLKIITPFLTYLLKNDEFINYVMEGAKGVKMPRGDISSIKKYPLAYPSLAEQQKIADCLSSLDGVIALEGQKLVALKDHKKGLMQNLFPSLDCSILDCSILDCPQDGNHLDGNHQDGNHQDGNPQEGNPQEGKGKAIPNFRFPEFQDDPAWEEKKLGDLGELVNGLTYSPNDIRNNGLLVLRSSNVQSGMISLKDNVYVNDGIKGANLSRANDILICVRNGSKTLIGKNALIPKDMPLCTHGAFMTVVRSKTPLFTFQLLQTSDYQRQVDGDLGATINSINSRNLLNYRFLVPDTPAEQQKIADCLSSLDGLITAQAQKIISLKDHKKGLMQNLFPSLN